MSHAVTNSVTAIVLLVPWLLFLVWEIYVLVRRGSDVRVRTISMVALERGHHLSSIVYLWGGMAAHWWWPSSSSSATWAGVLFWVLVLPLVFHDARFWGDDHRQWQEWRRFALNPLAVLVVGVLAGKVLFPQVA